jgi:tetratricopeptide (TPR) repeat protein
VLRNSTVVVCLVALAVSAGCAARQPADRGLTDSLIKNRNATPKVSIGTPAKAPEESLETYMQKVRHLAASARPAPTDRSPAAEGWDPELKTALAELAKGETASRQRSVGAAYRRLGVTDAAYRHFARAVQVDPADAASHDGLARLWRDWRMPHVGLGDAMRAIFHAPRSAAAYNTLGTIRQALGDRAGARKAYEHALTLEPAAAYALNNLCYVSLLDGQSAAAERSCERALAASPMLAAARNNLGLARALGGKLQAAAETFEHGGNAAAGQYNIGIAHFMRHDYARAAEAFEASDRLEPSTTSAARARQSRTMAEGAHEPKERQP